MLRLILLHLINDPDATCTVFLMAEGERRRRAYRDDKIDQLFQGRQYASQGGQRVVTYPGDREVRSRLGSRSRWATSTWRSRTPRSDRMYPTSPSGFRRTWRGTHCRSRKGDSSSADILRLFAALPLPPGDSPAGRFAAQPIPGMPSCSIGKDAAGNPVLLVETDEAGPRGQATPIVLDHLSVLHNIDCRLQPQGGGANTRRCSVVRCCGDDRLLHEYFLRALAPILGALPPRPHRRAGRRCDQHPDRAVPACDPTTAEDGSGFVGGTLRHPVGDRPRPPYPVLAHRAGGPLRFRGRRSAPGSEDCLRPDAGPPLLLRATLPARRITLGYRLGADGAERRAGKA